MKKDKIDITVIPKIGKMDIVENNSLTTDGITQKELNQLLESLKDGYPEKIRIYGASGKALKTIQNIQSRQSVIDDQEQLETFKGVLPENPQDISIEFIDYLIQHDKATALKIIDTLITLWKMEFFGIIPGQVQTIQ